MQQLWQQLCSLTPTPTQRTWKSSYTRFTCVPDNLNQTVYECSKLTVGTLMRILVIQKDAVNLQFFSHKFAQSDAAYSVNLQNQIDSDQFAVEFAAIAAFYNDLELIFGQKINVMLYHSLDDTAAIATIPQNPDLFETALRVLSLYASNAPQLVLDVVAANWHDDGLRNLACTLILAMLVPHTITDYVSICKRTSPVATRQLIVYLGLENRAHMCKYQRNSLVCNAIRAAIKAPTVTTKCNFLRSEKLCIRLCTCKYLLFDKTPPDLTVWPLGLLYLPYLPHWQRRHQMHLQLQQEYLTRLRQGQYTNQSFDAYWPP